VQLGDERVAFEGGEAGDAAVVFIIFPTVFGTKGVGGDETGVKPAKVETVPAKMIVFIKQDGLGEVGGRSLAESLTQLSPGLRWPPKSRHKRGPKHTYGDSNSTMNSNVNHIHIFVSQVKAGQKMSSESTQWLPTKSSRTSTNRSNYTSATRTVQQTCMPAS
jgi:hypothetical protein